LERFLRILQVQYVYHLFSRGDLLNFFPCTPDGARDGRDMLAMFTAAMPPAGEP
jgi:hypothetical protein